MKVRLKNSGKVQEGDKPAEDVNALFKELDDAFGTLENLVYRINVTNTNTVCDGESVTRMMARKDALTLRVSLLYDILKHVMENDSRYGRNELKQVRIINVPELRKETDSYAYQLRELDMKLQNLNWTTELM